MGTKGFAGARRIATCATWNSSNPATVAVEAPLEIRVAGRPLAVTLRTPGDDVLLTLGFLLAEGVIERRGEVAGWQLAAPDSEPGGGPETGERDATNPSTADAPLAHPSGAAVIDVELTNEALDRWARRRVEREFRSNSACGACGKPSLADLYIEPRCAGGRDAEPVALPGEAESIHTLVERAAAAQELFRLTGGVHGAAAFDTDGQLLAVYEDVGRHNALDKLIGWALSERRDARQVDRPSPSRLPGAAEDLLDGLLVLSTGRAGFEIVQKALRARAGAVITLGAATDWAVELAREGNLALVGFGGGEPVRYC